MPFTIETLNVLKEALAQTPDHYFRDESMIEGIMERTGLTRTSVLDWAEKVRWMVNIGLITDMAAFLLPGEHEVT
jgi:DUF438 domain-containing protein